MTEILNEQNPKLGYYTVGDKIFYVKPLALIDASKSGHFPVWNFNNDIFGKVQWKVEPESSLLELYRLRAQQLRDRYDYIRLEVSGGGDSSTAAYSFIKNKIHLDEVVFRYPKTGEKNMLADPFNTKDRKSVV